MNFQKNNGIYLGQIQKVYYIDDEENRVNAQVVYDILIFDNFGRGINLKQVPSIKDLSGLNDYSEKILEQNEIASDGENNIKNQPSKKNGSYVIVGFLNGEINNPIILGGYKHESNISDFTKEKGPRKVSQYRGLKQEINKDGELEITFKGANNPDGTPVVEGQIPAVIKIGLSEGTSQEADHHSIVITSGEEAQKIEAKTSTGHKVLIDETNGLIEISEKEGADKITITKDSVEVSSGTNVKVTAGDSTLHLDNGKVALGAGGNEVLALMDELLDVLAKAFDSMAKETHTGNLGYQSSPPVNFSDYVEAFVKINTEIKKKLNSIKGTL